MVNEKILDFIKKRPVYVSGEEISREIGITRAAIWKHIQELRDLGYDITAVPHLGYKLISSPDRLFSWEIKQHLRNKSFVKKIHYYESLPSTMDKAMELALGGACEGTLVIVEGQTKGKGRMGRQWLSPKYKGVYFSLILKPKISLQQASLITLISALAVCEALNQKFNLQAQIKWPNDILINNKKIAGILTELHAETDMVNAVIVGIGINVNNEKDTLPHAASSLKEIIKGSVNRLDLLENILSCFKQEYSQFQDQGAERILNKCRQFSATLGKRVTLSMADKRRQLCGQALDFDSSGGLLIRQDSGIVERVMTGDIIHCKR